MTKTSLLTFWTLGLALAACGDSAARPDAGAPIDAPPAPPRAVVVAGDYTAGSVGVLSTLDPATREVKINVGPAMAVGSDPMLRHLGNELLIVNRSENNVTILDDQTLAFKAQLGTGTSSNPQDVAVAGDKLFVATFNGKGVNVLTRGTATIATIDLSADDPDGEPNCNSIYLVGTTLYVTCELLDAGFQPRGPGKVYVIDSATRAIKTSLALTNPNPLGLLEQIPAMAPNAGDLLIPTAKFPPLGSSDPVTGCVERITTGAAPTAPGCLVTNTDLGGYAGRVGFLIEPGQAITFFAVPTTPGHGNLRAFDMPSSSFWSGALNPPAQAIGDLAVCPEGQTIVTDTTSNTNGLRIYNGGTELTTAPLAIGKPPVSSHGLVCY